LVYVHAVEESSWFLEELSAINQVQRQAMINKLTESGYCEDVGETILEMLDRSDVNQKPKMIGLVFKALIEEKCTVDELYAMVATIEHLSLPALQRLPDFAKTSSMEQVNQLIPEYMQQLYMANGVARSAALLGSGFAINPNEFCQLLVLCAFK
jgi:hypothetical protein